MIEPEFNERCCVCGGSNGLVWDMPQAPSDWIHFNCIEEIQQYFDQRERWREENS